MGTTYRSAADHELILRMLPCNSIISEDFSSTKNQDRAGQCKPPVPDTPVPDSKICQRVSWTGTVEGALPSHRKGAHPGNLVGQFQQKVSLVRLLTRNGTGWDNLSADSVIPFSTLLGTRSVVGSSPPYNYKFGNKIVG